MRLSMDMMDARNIKTRHDEYLASLCLRAIILLNGKRVKCCTYANEERGYIVKYQEPLWAVDDILQMETIRGEVRIIDPDEENLIAEGYTRCDRG